MTVLKAAAETNNFIQHKVQIRFGAGRVCSYRSKEVYEPFRLKWLIRYQRTSGQCHTLFDLWCNLNRTYELFRMSRKRTASKLVIDFFRSNCCKNVRPEIAKKLVRFRLPLKHLGF